MRYVGGKARIAKWVAEVVLEFREAGWDHYVEPFVGAGHVFAEVAPHFPHATARDAHPDLIMMWKALVGGWVPPTHVSKEEYDALRHAPSSALRGVVGFGASWGGKWFGGYVDQAWDEHHGRHTKPYLDAAVRSLPPVVAAMGAATIECAAYDTWAARPNQIIYCDPPYANTLGYAGTTFDSARFWSCARSWAATGAIVLVSESVAPDWAIMVACRERKAMLKATAGVEQAQRVEAIWLVP